jgi:hypothetical protein
MDKRHPPATEEELVHAYADLFNDVEPEERTRSEFRVNVARDNGFWVQGTLRPW